MTSRTTALPQQAWIAAVLAFVIGVILGWTVLGWVLFPVQYINADPADLNPSAKGQYIAMVADSFSLNGDIALARQRLNGFDNAELATILRQLVEERTRAGRALEAQRLNTFARSYGLTLTATGPTPRPTTAPVSGTSLMDTLGPLLLGLILLIVAVAIGLFAYNRLRPSVAGRSFTRRERESTVYEDVPVTTATGAPPAAVVGAPASTMDLSSSVAPSGAATIAASPTVSASTRSAPPTRPAPTRGAAPAAATSLGTFAATYKFGDDSYDTSFTLETPRGEFLGECGMGISELIGEGKPDKVAAFDVWLFDKTDVRTVTQILMSEHAYNDLASRNRLAPKGELTLAEKGKHLVLETATLRVEAEIKDLVYASTPGLPPNSHFQRLIVEMVANQKQT